MSAAARDAAAAPSRAAIGARAGTSRLAQVKARLRIIELEGAMPVDDIQVKRIPAVRVAELTATAARLEPASINPVIQPLYRELGERLSQAGLTPAGPATSYYEDAPDGDGDRKSTRLNSSHMSIS